VFSNSFIELSLSATEPDVNYGLTSNAGSKVKVSNSGRKKWIHGDLRTYSHKYDTFRQVE